MEKKARAQHAERLLNDDVLQEAFSVVKEYHTERMMRANTADGDVLEARRDFLALERVIGQLRSFVSDGRILEKRDRDREND